MLKPKITHYDGPAGGWGSAKSLTEILTREHVPITGAEILMKQNKPDGFACVSCAWAKPAHPRTFEYCENGAKATAWEITRRRTTPEFFAQHTVRELLRWSDHDLEEHGRLTHPMRYDASQDRYVPVSWEEAFAEIGRELKAMDPKKVVFYASGRASLETAYMYALMARLYGCNNLPDSSNMCHESTSVALPQVIGVPVGTVTLDDFKKTDCIFFFGQNPGSNAPRMLHELQEASRRNVPIVTFNPVRERGLERFTNPQSPVEMLSGQSTRISSQYHQVKAGGDIAAITGMCKALFAMDDAGAAQGHHVIDREFIAEHTHGFEDFERFVRAATWDDIVRASGLTRTALEAAAAVYARAERVMGIYGMGLTQHREGVDNIKMLVNLLLLRGNIGTEGAGILPVRGHSNVQGQRTVGITEKPELVPMDKLRELYQFEPPTEKGLNTIEACEKLVAGELTGFISLGGNFARAIPDTDITEPAWRGLRLNVQIATKLNRSHLLTSEITYLLPCLGRIEIDRQASGEQAVSVEDSTACIHGSKGRREPASPHLLSEPAIVAGIAKATVPPNPRVDWDMWVADYARVRDAIELTYPKDFEGFNERMWKPGGFHRPLPARHREWKTKTGKANFSVPEAGFNEDPDMPEKGAGVLRLMTLRSNGQFNTTIYNYEDRFRGISGTRTVLMLGRNDIDRLGLRDGQVVALETVSDDGVKRRVSGLRVAEHALPDGCCAGYYPELNPLIPLWHHAKGSKVPAAKSIPVRIVV